MPTPNKIWTAWINKIAADPDMDKSRLIEHIQLHVQKHMPNADAHQTRWLQWLAGTYNLLAILSAMVECHPDFDAGVAKLFQRWRQHPHDHTPPPAGMVGVARELHSRV
jgi:hypothetical protein